MSYRQPGYGFTAECQSKIASKYSTDDESKCCNWIAQIINENPPLAGKDNAYAWLKDGTKLCKLINNMFPGSVKKVNVSKMAFKQMENIGNFLKAVDLAGVPKLDVFQTVDLYENQNLQQVWLCLLKLSSVAETKGFPGPHIGVKIAEKKERRFSEDKLREGRNVIGLQMGTNKVASQAGMTPYGLGRQMVTGIKK